MVPLAMALSACPECSRHVRTDARVCPFCDHALPSSFGLARAGKALVGAAAITALTACPRAATKYGGPPPPEPALEQPADGSEPDAELEQPAVPEDGAEEVEAEGDAAADDAVPDAE